ncbi:MAG: sigma 54-dependent Fis family transcriptional regulator [Candidatus Hydrogenedentes bacterium]|nr:sigma 54-dependent Fis family transcriptional regulator [Candidatus Hydrogenedentota bacterium]
MAWILSSKSGCHEGLHWDLAAGPFVLGRDTGCDIVITDPRVSWRHCKVYEHGGRAYLADLGGAQPAHANGDAMREREIATGDIISLGATVFTVTRRTAAAGTRSAARMVEEVLGALEGPPGAAHRDGAATLGLRTGQGAPLLGKSRAMIEARALIRDMARTPLNILITGETGTGKEIAAQMLHEGSTRATGPLISVNCAAIPDHLFESEMFGHEKGAFTSADKKRRGRFALAHEGTLFLDEIGELSPENQARLLRVLERGVYHPVGAECESYADVRVIAATNRDLKRAIHDGRFRRDLYHRICAVEIELPPLRQRPSDIPLLAQHFFRDYGTRNKHHRLGISPEAMERLIHTPWPGNVRELRNAIERATALAKGDWITPQDLNFLNHAQRPGEDPMGPAFLPLAEVERQHIVKVLDACGFNISAAAKVLRVHRNTLHNKIAEYGIGG